jgi:hypothetical protein
VLVQAADHCLERIGVEQVGRVVRRADQIDHPGALALGDLVQLGAETDGQEPLEYYAVLSFFAGFSERWVRGVLSPVSQLAGGEEEPPETTVKPAKPGLES